MVPPSSRIAVFADYSNRGIVCSMMPRCLLALVLASSSVSQPLSAQVDQEHWGVFIGHGFNSTMVRQEFTPSLQGLDSLQLSIGQDPILAPIVSFSGLAAVAIRDEGISGPIIAQSSPMFLPAFFSGTPAFRFPELVSLTPGRTYAFELVNLTAGGYWILGGNSSEFSPGYPGGRLYLNGGVAEGDLLFREGIGIPEPSSLVLLALSLAIIALIEKWRRFRKKMLLARLVAVIAAVFWFPVDTDIFALGIRASRE
jgi:hypothetical protein